MESRHINNCQIIIAMFKIGLEGASVETESELQSVDVLCCQTVLTYIIYFSIIKRNHSSASGLADSNAFLHSMVFHLSVVICHTRTPCLNHFTDVHATLQVHLQGPATHCVR